MHILKNNQSDKQLQNENKNAMFLLAMMKFLHIRVDKD